MTEYFGTATKGQGTWYTTGDSEIHGQVATLHTLNDEIGGDNQTTDPLPSAVFMEWAMPEDGLPPAGTEMIFPIFNSNDFVFSAKRSTGQVDSYTATLFGVGMSRTVEEIATPVFTPVETFKQFMLTVFDDGSAELWVEGRLLFTAGANTNTDLDAQQWKFGPLSYQPSAPPAGEPRAHSPHLSNVRFFYQPVSSEQASTLSGGELPSIGD
jgi:hypothetical protein